MATEVLKAIIKGDNKPYKKALNEAEKQTNQFSKQIKKIGGLIAGAFALNEIKAFTIGAAKLDAKLQGVERAFAKLNQPSLLSDLQKATRGTVTDLELMQRAVQAKNFKIPLDQLATYFKFATDRAIETGESVDYLVESIITGIGRKSVMIMDNLGISAAELSQKTKELGDFGAAAGHIINQEMSKAGNVADTSATRYARWATIMENFETKVGGVANSFIDLILPIKKGSELLSEQRVRVNSLVIQLTALNTSEESRKKIYDELKTLSKDVVDGIDAENINIKKLTANLKLYNEEQIKKIAIARSEERIQDLQDKAGKALDKRLSDEERLSLVLNRNANYAAKFGETYEKQAKDIVNSSKSYENKLKDLKSLLEEIDKAGGDQFTNAAIKELETSQDNYNDLKREEKRLFQQVNVELQKYTDRYKKIFGVGKSTTELLKSSAVSGLSNTLKKEASVIVNTYDDLADQLAEVQKQIRDNVLNGTQEFLQGLLEQERAIKDAIKRIDNAVLKLYRPTLVSITPLQSIKATSVQGNDTEIEGLSGIGTQGLAAATSGLAEAGKEAFEQADNFRDITIKLTDAFGGLFNELTDSMEDTSSRFLKILSSMVSFVGIISGDTAFTAFGSLFSNIIGFADGGTTPYTGNFLVGERGPEMVSLPGGAKITPNNLLAGSQELHARITGEDIYLSNKRYTEKLNKIT